MAYQNAHSTHASDLFHGLLDGITAAFGAVGNFLISISAANQRLHLVERLQAKSDEELAELGMRREDIVRYVFRDILHV